MSTQPNLDVNHRDHFVGRVLVRADRGGPWRFERCGQVVECVCDNMTGITCQYHLVLDRPRGSATI
jgi:hypothetical protein